MPIVMPDEQFPAMPVIVMIVGTPFSFKTSLAMTAHNAIHVDGDRGAQRAIRNCPVLQVTSWREVRAEEANGIFKDKSTCILDTPKSLIDDFIWDWCQQENYTANTQKVYGNVGTEFKQFASKRRADLMDIIVVSHEKSKDQGDKTIYEPDITGQSKQLLLRMCDQVGFMWKQEVKGQDGKMSIRTVITFNPRPEWPFCKNVANLPDIIIPHYTLPEWKGFMDREIIQPTKDAMIKMTDEQRQALQLIENWRKYIDSAIPIEGNEVETDVLLKRISKEVSEVTPEHMKKQLQAYLLGHLSTIGWKWNGDPIKMFKPVGAVVTPPAAEKPADLKPAVSETPSVQAETPVVVEEKPELVAETVPPAEEIDLAKDAEQQRETIKLPAPTGPVINKNPHMGPPKADLFEKTPEGK